MAVAAHTAIALLVCLTFALVTGFPWIGLLCAGLLLYPVRERRQKRAGKGYGTAAWVVPLVACLALTAALYLTHSGQKLLDLFG